MQERRTLVYIKEEDIPASAVEVDLTLSYTGNVLYVPIYNDNHSTVPGSTTKCLFPYIYYRYNNNRYNNKEFSVQTTQSTTYLSIGNNDDFNTIVNGEITFVGNSSGKTLYSQPIKLKLTQSSTDYYITLSCLYGIANTNIGSASLAIPCDAYIKIKFSYPIRYNGMTGANEVYIPEHVPYIDTE